MKSFPIADLSLHCMALTDRQQKVLHFIRHTELQRGEGPTTREVQAHFGFRSQTAAVRHINALARRGALDKKPAKARAVTTSPPRLEIIHVPIFGTVPAGTPELVEQIPDGYVVVDRFAIGVPKDAQLFATYVRGDSMINAHILDGDLAVLQVDCVPRSGKIVAALIDGETTLKRFIQRNDETFLHAENPLYPDLIPTQELVIQGVLVHSQRNFSGCGPDKPE